MLVNVLAKIRKIKRTAKAIRKNYSKKSKIAVVLRRRGASSDRPTINNFIEPLSQFLSFQEPPVHPMHGTLAS